MHDKQFNKERAWLREEPGFFILDKPAGMNVHDEDGDKGVVNRCRDFLNDADIFPCHRLDKDTSGLLLLAKGKHNTAQLSQLFADRKITKYYLALSASKPSKKQGAVIGDMAPSRDGNWKLKKTFSNPAITQFFSYGLQGKRVFILKPSTGKTHQIRVALRSLSAPVFGDRRYEAEMSTSKADRMYLHAYQLMFRFSGIDYCFKRPPTTGELFLSTEFSEQLTKIGDPHSLTWPVLK